MTLKEMKPRCPSPTALFPPTITAFFAVDGGLRISSKSLKTWWPGTELNRRRQPFQGCALPPELPGHFLKSTVEPVRIEGCACSQAELPVIAGSQTLGACGTAPIMTTKLDSLNPRSEA